MDSRIGKILVILFMGAVTIGSISVTGLLQSTERIGASGIIVRPTETAFIPPSTGFNPIPPPPEPEIEIDIYSNYECTNVLTNVEWGEIEAGESSSSTIYVKNNGDTSVTLSLTTENWSSNTAQDNMNLSWDFDGNPVQSGEVVEVTLSLSVDPDCPELDNFGFDIIIIGS